jgi:hypothetical protein
MANPNPLKAIRKLWKIFEAAPFPEKQKLSDDWIERVDLGALDSYTAGCISTFLSHKGHLDLWRTAILGLCYGELCECLPGLEGEGQEYFARLKELAHLVLAAVRDDAAPHEDAPDV